MRLEARPPQTTRPTAAFRRLRAQTTTLSPTSTSCPTERAVATQKDKPATAALAERAATATRPTTDAATYAAKRSKRPERGGYERPTPKTDSERAGSTSP